MKDTATTSQPVIEARGLGLSLPLDTFWFQQVGSRISARFLPEVGDDPDTWQFVQTRPTDFHVIAVAARRTHLDLPELRVRLRRAPLPLPFDLEQIPW